MTPSKLKYLLFLLILVLLTGLLGGTWQAKKVLEGEVLKTDHAKTDADLSQSEVQKYKKLAGELQANQDLVQRTKRIAASSTQYHYQDQVIRDLASYAAQDGVTISSFDFGAAAANPKAAPTGKTSFNINLQGPLKYTQFLSFLRHIELNVTKLQVISIALAPDTRTPNQILNPTIGLQVFLKR